MQELQVSPAALEEKQAFALNPYALDISLPGQRGPKTPTSKRLSSKAEPGPPGPGGGTGTDCEGFWLVGLPRGSVMSMWDVRLPPGLAVEEEDIAVGCNKQFAVCIFAKLCGNARP